MAYQRANSNKSTQKGKTEWVQLGVGWDKPASGKLKAMAFLNIDGQQLKVRLFHTDKSKSKSKNPSDFTITIPKDELPDGMDELFVQDKA